MFLIVELIALAAFYKLGYLELIYWVLMVMVVLRSVGLGAVLFGTAQTHYLRVINVVPLAMVYCFVWGSAYSIAQEVVPFWLYLAMPISAIAIYTALGLKITKAYKAGAVPEEPTE